jgi:hypothetical protein
VHADGLELRGLLARALDHVVLVHDEIIIHVALLVRARKRLLPAQPQATPHLRIKMDLALRVGGRKGFVAVSMNVRSGGLYASTMREALWVRQDVHQWHVGVGMNLHSRGVYKRWGDPPA